MSAYKKTDIDVAIVDWLQKNSNKENTFCIDEIIKQIYEVEDREFNELIDKKYNNNNCKQKRSEKRNDRRNQNRKTVAKHLEKLISNVYMYQTLKNNIGFLAYRQQNENHIWAVF